MTNFNSLFDILGILIGFMAVMLLLSLLVTALVQAAQATIHLRARNLKKGLVALFDNTLGETPNNKKKVEKIINERSFDVMGRKKTKINLLSKFKGSPVSYIDPKVLIKAFDIVKLGLRENQIEKLKSGVIELWERIERQLEKRFLLFIRLITITCAFLVAFYFQVSTPDLLHKLSINPNLRAQFVAEALKLTEGTEVTTDLKDVPEQALTQLVKQHPELKKFLEKVSGKGKNKEEILDEITIMLVAKAGEIGKIRKSYEEILDGLYKEKKEKSLEQAREVVDDLGRFDITPWQYGPEFYLKEGAVQWKNLIGILFTAILLSFGAPFWFERLKDVIKLKDVLSEGIKTNDKKSGKKGSGK